MNATRFVEFNDGLCVKYHPDVDYQRLGARHQGFKEFRDMWESHTDYVRYKHHIGQPTPDPIESQVKTC